jgi:transcriptional regulator with XRE-family HTH domain
VTVKRFCTPGVIYPANPAVHDAYMAKRPAKRVISRLRPLYQRTFIRQWREFREMSQEELAFKVGEYLADRGISDSGYTHASIGRLERGLMPYKQPIMEGIAGALGVTVETLIARPPPKEPGRADAYDELMGLWKKADADDQAKFVEIFRTITRKSGTNG